MRKQDFKMMASMGTMLMDGATGTNMMKAGMRRGECTEVWISEHPEAIQDLQRAYVDAGSQIVLAPTFGAQPCVLKKQWYRGDPAKLNRELVKLSKDAVGCQAFVAGDMSTMVSAMDSFDPSTLPQMVEEYRCQIVAMLEGGADLIFGETLLYPQEGEAILTAVEAEGLDIPVLISYTMQQDGSLFSGMEAGPVLKEMEEAGAAAVGFNCVNADAQLPELTKKMRGYVKGLLISKPNAGMPTISMTGEAVYSLGADEFFDLQKKAVAEGANLIGGCCGTTPEYIQKLAALRAF